MVTLPMTSRTLKGQIHDRNTLSLRA